MGSSEHNLAGAEQRIHCPLARRTGASVLWVSLAVASVPSTDPTEMHRRRSCSRAGPGRTRADRRGTAMDVHVDTHKSTQARRSLMIRQKKVRRKHIAYGELIRSVPGVDSVGRGQTGGCRLPECRPAHIIDLDHVAAGARVARHAPSRTSYCIPCATPSYHVYYKLFFCRVSRRYPLRRIGEHTGNRSRCCCSP